MTPGGPASRGWGWGVGGNLMKLRTNLREPRKRARTTTTTTTTTTKKNHRQQTNGNGKGNEQKYNRSAEMTSNAVVADLTWPFHQPWHPSRPPPPPPPPPAPTPNRRCDGNRGPHSIAFFLSLSLSLSHSSAPLVTGNHTTQSAGIPRRR